MEPAFRGQGHATRLVGAVEDLARATEIPTLWLHTRTAEPLYTRCGWTVVERILKDGKTYDLMKRELTASRVLTNSVR
ncbi:MAG: GNAT family N-acetyltransferase [Janthinobacterium lividum]